ncbi:MAG TPA: class III poly(R)-hydroxyalkanoic acid synthase subunit PhaC [Gammaproteobacteria bacterium]|nr:class III poly(R)-hydroxyalkanoic acid synthase subunit PhaC [Gammaproteobacteria bacterium]|tara:strand:- start:4857 stop:6011 length:1155 start_codon:yes stop_codon:yes gene_type:complete
MNNPMINPVLDQQKEFEDYFDKVGSSINNFVSLPDSEVKIGETPKEEVLKLDKVTLYRYFPLDGVKPANTRPLLIAYSLIGSYTMLDLQRDRSVIRNLLLQGQAVYVIDWGHPNKSDKWLSFDDYVESYLSDCVDYICDHHNLSAISLLGICEGGVFAACYASLHPERIASLALAVTPIDFHADQGASTEESVGYLNRLLRKFSRAELEAMIDAFGYLPGETTGLVFLEMTLVKSITKYNWELLDSLAGDRDKVLNFLRMEKWLLDRPHHPSEAAKHWLIDLYNENRLVKGEFELEGEKVRLSQLSMPVLNIFAKHDHIVPPATSKALQKHLSRQTKYEELELNAGHIGAFVSGKANQAFSDKLFSWVAPLKSTPRKPAKKTAK